MDFSPAATELFNQRTAFRKGNKNPVPLSVESFHQGEQGPIGTVELSRLVNEENRDHLIVRLRARNVVTKT